MEGLISLAGFALWIGVWVLIVKRRKKMGLLVSNIAGLVGGFIAFAVFIAIVAPKPAPEETQARGDASVESHKALIDQAKKEQESAAAVAAEAKAKKEREEAAAANQDRSVMAAIICSNYVEASLKSPKSADFPWDKAAGGSSKLGNQTYFVRSYVDAQNSFGAELRNWYECKIQYRSGEDVNPASWKLIALDFK